MKLKIDRSHAPATWVAIIIEKTKGRLGGVVVQHLVGATLERRFRPLPVSNHPAHGGDTQTGHVGAFTLADLVYHIAPAPSRSVLQKCAENIRSGLRALLLVPREQKDRARILAEEDNIAGELTILAIEDFVALNIIELATEESKEFFAVLKEIVDIYNKRLSQVETDLSLLIEVR